MDERSDGGLKTTPTEQKIERARLHCGPKRRILDQGHDLALAFNICRSRLQRLEAIERDKWEARAPDTIHQFDHEPHSGLSGRLVASPPQPQHRYPSCPTTIGSTTVTSPVVRSPSLHSHMAAVRPHHQATRGSELQREPAAAEPNKKRKRADTFLGRMQEEFVLPSVAMPHAERLTPNLPRRAFVTVGATASFRPLLAEILRPSFLAWMVRYGFDNIQVQCGPDLAWFRSMVDQLDFDLGNLKISCFRYTTNMRDFIIPCRPVEGVSNAGIVICHAGAGTVIDVSRCSVPFVIVPNEDLLDNHQAELATYLDGEQWAVSAKPKGLADAIMRAHVQAYAGGMFPLAPDLAHLDLNDESDGTIFPMPTHKRITLLDWMARSCYPEQGESGAKPCKPHAASPGA
ncbi:hypothetical protein RB595_002666 [Gaeumannomyces hyphopodioides]